MVSVINSIDTAHEEPIHDAQVDYYGTRLATCSSDKSVKVFDIRNGQSTLIGELKGHEGPVWQIAWSHPMFGNLLASCSYDRKIIIWREENGVFNPIYENSDHTSSVNCIAWAPHQLGLMLASGSSDGSIYVISTSGDGTWDARKILGAHPTGVTSVSWAPALPAGALLREEPAPVRPVRRLVSGGADTKLKIWREQDGEWQPEQTLEQHSDWVRDVAWAPSLGLGRHRIASCSQDGRVVVWTSEDGNRWLPLTLAKWEEAVWRVSWSVTGELLAVAAADGKVTLWKENTEDKWVCISDVVKGQGIINN